MQPKRLLLAASLVLFTSCKGSDTVAGGALSGTFSFSYSGGISGTFNASGVLPTSSSAQTTQSWAAGVMSTADGGVYAEGAVPRTASTHDFAFFFVHRTTVGSDNISSSCSANCSEFAFFFDAANSGATSPSQFCVIETGTITITEISATRVKGTFSGTGTCISSPGGATTSFTVTGGTFDVALVSAVP